MGKFLTAERSSTLGSIDRAEYMTTQKSPAYKISKAAVNMLNKQWALDLGEEGLTFVLVSPGVSIMLSLPLDQRLILFAVVENRYG
jgi:NAD(P)-dependent dehydrogenase (short-subunit alcohol dehydrogenase family)